jgi:RNA polymerase sigma-70 factor, ECF subfamily
VFQSEQEFERIVMPETARLLRFALRLTRNPQAAEDLVQETLLNAWRGFRQFRSGAGVRPWLFRILVNAFYGLGRKTRLEVVPLEDAGARSTVIDKLEMAQALDALPVDQRTVLLLGVVEGFTCREVSEILSIPIGTVMSRLSRAREALRQKLAPVRGVAAGSREDF